MPTTPSTAAPPKTPSHETAASSFAVCPVRDCVQRFDEGGLTEDHLAEHCIRDGPGTIADALFRLHRAHARILALESLSFEAIRSSLARDVIEALADRAEHRLDAISVAVGERPEVVRGCLRRLASTGAVLRVRKGVYRLPLALDPQKQGAVL